MINGFLVLGPLLMIRQIEEAVYGRDNFQLIKDDYVILFNGEETQALYNYKIDGALLFDLKEKNQQKKRELEMEIKAFRQLYNKSIIYNQMIPIQN